MSLSVSETATLQIIVTVAASFSIVGTIFIFVLYLRFRLYKLYLHYKLITYLTITDFTSSVFFIIGTHTLSLENQGLCLTVACFLQFSLLSSVLWTGCIAFLLYRVFTRRVFEVRHYEKYFHLICWGSAAATTVIGAVCKCYGEAELWCWITLDHGIFRFILFYLPLVAVLTFNCVMFVLISRALSRPGERPVVDPSKGTTGSHRLQTKLRWFLIVFVVVWVPGLVDRAQQFLLGKPWFWLACIQAATTPLQGFLNSIVYGLHSEVRRKLKWNRESQNLDEDSHVSRVIPPPTKNDQKQVAAMGVTYESDSDKDVRGRMQSYRSQTDVYIRWES